MSDTKTEIPEKDKQQAEQPAPLSDEELTSVSGGIFEYKRWEPTPTKTEKYHRQENCNEHGRMARQP